MNHAYLVLNLPLYGLAKIVSKEKFIVGKKDKILCLKCNKDKENCVCLVL